MRTYKVTYEDKEGLKREEMQGTQQKTLAESLAKQGKDVIDIKDVTYEKYAPYKEETTKAIKGLKIPKDMQEDLLYVVHNYCDPRTRNRKKEVATK